MSISAGIKAMNAKKMWKLGFTGDKVNVGIIGNGIMDHPDLKDKVTFRRNYTNYNGPILSKHETMIAGIIAAKGKILGVAPDANLYDYRIVDKDKSVRGEHLRQAIIDASNDGCHVINLSIGTSTDTSALHDAIKYAYGNGTCIVVAAGNNGDGNNNTDEYVYPAAYPETISVGCVDCTDKYKPSTFSNSNEYVNCCAHGVNVPSTSSNNGYDKSTGTSISAPHISGAIALLIDQAMKTNTSIRNSDIYPKLLSHAKDIYIPGPDNTTGSGFVQF